MSFDRGRVERKRNGIFAGLGQRFKDRAPSSALCPTIEAIVDRRVRPVFRWTIAPPRTRLQHVNDAADDAPIVVPIRSGQSRRQVRFYPRPLLIIDADDRDRDEHHRQRPSNGSNREVAWSVLVSAIICVDFPVLQAQYPSRASDEGQPTRGKA